MKKTDLSRSSTSNYGINRWANILIILKAVGLGFLVDVIGVGSWILVLMLIPTPWSILAMAILLWVFWQFFSGKWGWRSTQTFRREHFRNVRLSPATWKWGLIAAMLFVLVFQSGVVITFRIYDFPAGLFKMGYNYDTLPTWMAWLTIIMASLVAGICEETGFRGYMQTTLEKHFSPHISIVIVSVVFLSVHLHQAWAPPLYLHIFMASALFGYLAHATGSILPGIIGHFVLDVVNFSYWWSDLAGKFERKTIDETGIDGHFMLWLVVLLFSFTLFIVVVKKLINIRSLN